MSVIYLVLASWLIVNQPPDQWLILGVIIIVLSGLYIWRRERRLAKAGTAVEVLER